MEGWDRLGAAISKLLLYIGSIFSVAVAFWCWMAAAVKYGFKRIDVGVSSVLWASVCAAYYVLYVWWPTPEMLVRAASRNDILHAEFCLDQRADINSIASCVLDPDVKRRTALTAAVRANDLTRVRLSDFEWCRPEFTRRVSCLAIRADVVVAAS